MWFLLIAISLAIGHGNAKNVVPKIRLSSGYDMPMVGFGTGTMIPDEVEKAVSAALENGYNFIDTAYVYKNEYEVGQALKKYFANGGKRENLFISTKLPAFGYKPGDVEKFIRISLKNLGLEYLDLYIIHHSVPIEPDDETGLTIKVVNNDAVRGPSLDLNRIWKEMEAQVLLGRTRSIGLSNFDKEQMETIYDNASIKPSNWQVEIHGYYQQRDLRQWAKAHNVSVTAYSPLASVSVAKAMSKFRVPLIKHPIIKKIAEKHKKSPAQVLLRNLVQDGLIVIPKSVHPRRMRENLNIFDFELSKREMKEIEDLDMGAEGKIWTFKGMYKYLAHQELESQKHQPDEKYPIKQHQDEKHPAEKHPDEKHVHGKHPSEKHKDEKHSAHKHPAKPGHAVVEPPLKFENKIGSQDKPADTSGVTYNFIYNYYYYPIYFDPKAQELLQNPAALNKNGNKNHQYYFSYQKPVHYEQTYKQEDYQNYWQNYYLPYPW